MSNLLKQLETIGQNAAKRHEQLEGSELAQLQKISQFEMAALLFAPDENPTGDN